MRVRMKNLPTGWLVCVLAFCAFHALPSKPSAPGCRLPNGQTRSAETTICFGRRFSFSSWVCGIKIKSAAHWQIGKGSGKGFCHRHTFCLSRNWQHRAGRELIPGVFAPVELAGQVFEAPFVVVSHGTEADPILNYGNRAALILWEMSWQELIHTPSRLTAEGPVARNVSVCWKPRRGAGLWPVILASAYR